jgi:hypothetical protein
VRIERGDNRRATLGARPFDRFGHYPLMPKMKTIEIAERHDGALHGRGQGFWLRLEVVETHDQFA